MPQLLAYECPHCHETVRVDDDILGQDMDCPLCHEPFLVELPVAHPVSPDQVQPDAPEVHHAGREEDVIETAHPVMFRKHPLRFLGEWTLVIGGSVILGMAIGNVVYVNQTAQMIVGGLLAGVGVVLLLKWWLTVLFTKLSITNKRTILRRGIVSRFTTEVQHDDIRNIQVDQSFFERMFGVGDLAISSSGQDDLEVDVDGVPQPDRIASLIRSMQ